MEYFKDGLFFRSAREFDLVGASCALSALNKREGRTGPGAQVKGVTVSLAHSNTHIYTVQSHTNLRSAPYKCIPPEQYADVETVITWY